MKDKLTLSFSSILMGLILSALIISGCRRTTVEQSNVIQGSGNVVTEDRAVSGFNRVSLTDIGKVVVTQGDEESLIVQAEHNIMPYIETKVQDGTLILGFTDEASKLEFHINEPIKFYLNVKEIVGLDISGIGNVYAPSLDTNQLEMVAGLGGNVSVGSLTAKELVVRLAGRASVEVSGQVVEQHIFLAGGDYRGAKLESQTAYAEVEGIGNATVWATDALDVQVSGGGSVEYYGSPHVTQRLSGRAQLYSLGEPE